MTWAESAVTWPSTVRPRVKFAPSPAMRLASHGSEAQAAPCIFWPLSMIYGGETETGLGVQSSARV